MFRLLRITTLIFLSLCSLAAVQSFRDIETQVPPHQPSFGWVTIEELPDGLTHEEAVSTLDEAAETHQTTLTLESRDRGDGSLRTFYQFGEPPEPDVEVAAFDPDVTVTVEPSSEVGAEPLRGTYHFTGTEQELRGLLQTLQAADFDATSTDGQTLPFLLGRLSDVGLLPALGLGALSLILAVGYEVSQRRRVYLIQRLHGLSTLQIARHEAARCLRESSLSAVVGLAITAGALLLYNGWARFPDFLPWLVALLVTVVGTVTALVIACLIFWPQREDATTIKGAEPTRSQGIAAVMTQAVAVLAMSALIGSMISSVRSLVNQQESLAHWDRADDLVAVHYDGPDVEDPDSEVTAQFADYARERDQANSVLLSMHQEDYLLANQEFLEREDVTITTDHDPALPQVLAPTTAPEDTGERAWDRYTELITGMDPSLEKSTASFGEYAAPRDLFTYSETDTTNDAEHDHPVLIVFPEGLDGLPDVLFPFFGSDLLFDSPDTTHEELHELGFADYVSAYVDVAADARHQIIQAEHRIQATGAALLLSVGVLGVSATAAAGVHCARNRQRLFVSTIHGLSFLRIHGGFIGTLSTVTLLASGLGVLATPLPNVERGLLVAATVVVTTCLTAGITAAHHRRTLDRSVRRD